MLVGFDLFSVHAAGRVGGVFLHDPHPGSVFGEGSSERVDTPTFQTQEVSNGFSGLGHLRAPLTRVSGRIFLAQNRQIDLCLG